MAVRPYISLKLSNPPKAELFRLFRRHDEARAMKSHSTAGEAAISRQWFCRRNIRTNA
jgi:hypothetical protein